MPRSLPAPARRVVDAALEATVVLSFSRIGHAVRRRTDAWEPLESLDGRGRTVVVTGATSGLGEAAAMALARAGADVVVVARDEARGRRVVAALADAGPGTPAFERADLTDLDAVRALARRLRERPRIDAIVHNAGAMFPRRETTLDGLEQTYQLHVVAPFLLTHLLLDRLAPGARVITVTSGGMYAERLDADRVDSPGGYRPAVAYARAKRAQVALTDEWQRRHGDLGIAFAVVHPGWADTPGVAESLPGFHRLTRPILRDAEEGADSMVWLALAPDLGPGGRLWHDRRPRRAHKVPWTRAEAGEAARLWERVTRDAQVDASVPDHR